MNNKRKITFVILFFVMLSFILYILGPVLRADYISSSDSTITAEQLDELNLVKKGSLTVSTNVPFEPWEFKKGDKIVGVDISIAEEIAKKLGVPLEVQDVSFDALTLELNNGKCDMAIAAMSATDEKRKSVDFSDPYFSTDQAILVKNGSGIEKAADLQGKKIGAQLGTTGHSYCSDKYDTVTYNSPTDAVMDLVNNQIDAVVIDYFPAKRQAEKNKNEIKILDELLFSEEYRIAFPKGSNKLRKIANDIIADLKASNFVERKIEEFTSSNSEEEKLGFIDQIKLNLIEESRYKQIINGLVITFKITIMSLLIGVVLGYLTAITILSPNKGILTKILQSIAKVYVSAIRGTPVVCQLFIIYYLILSPLGASKIWCAIVSFGINSGAYVSEIIRSGILSVDIGQIEAGKSLGLNDRQIMINIIAPQALKNSLATLCNEFMQLVKETSIAGFIGVNELTRSGEIIRSQTLSPFVPLMTTALIYFTIVHLLGMLMSFFERRLRQSDKS